MLIPEQQALDLSHGAVVPALFHSYIEPHHYLGHLSRLRKDRDLDASRDRGGEALEDLGAADRAVSILGVELQQASLVIVRVANVKECVAVKREGYDCIKLVTYSML